MTNKIESALKAAIYEINDLTTHIKDREPETLFSSAEIVLSQCKSALSDIEKCEPVAYKVERINEDGEIISTSLCATKEQAYENARYGYTETRVIPLYTSPISKEWVGLSDDEIQEIAEEVYKTGGWDLDYGKAIEAKLKQLNAPKEQIKMTTNKTLRARFELFYKTITPAVPQAGYEDITMDAAYLSYKAATAEANIRIAELDSEIAELKVDINEYIKISGIQASEITELQAHINTLREALEEIKNLSVQSDDGYLAQDLAEQAISATPAESLQAHDNELIEKCADICYDSYRETDDLHDLSLADSIMALKQK